MLFHPQAKVSFFGSHLQQIVIEIAPFREVIMNCVTNCMLLDEATVIKTYRTNISDQEEDIMGRQDFTK